MSTGLHSSLKVLKLFLQMFCIESASIATMRQNFVVSSIRIQNQFCFSEVYHNISILIFTVIATSSYTLGSCRRGRSIQITMLESRNLTAPKYAYLIVREVKLIRKMHYGTCVNHDTGSLVSFSSNARAKYNSKTANGTLLLNFFTPSRNEQIYSLAI